MRTYKVLVRRTAYLKEVWETKVEGSAISGFTPVSGTFNLDDEMTSSETYDQNGNVTRIANGNTFVYDSENHLISMGGTVTLQYDGDGNRVAKTFGAAGCPISRRDVGDRRTRR